MVVDEKGLIRAMKEAYKSTGYKVAMDESGGIERVILSAALWTVVINRSELPQKILGLIAEHVGEIPEVNNAYQVRKKDTQTEIFDMVLQNVQDFRSGEKSRRIARKTSLVLDGYSIWQAATDLQVLKLDPEREEIMNWGRYGVWLIGDDLLMVDDDVSRVYIRCSSTRSEDELEKLSHLAKIQWVAAVTGK